MNVSAPLERAGMGPAAASAKRELFNDLESASRSAFDCAWFVPGRIEVLGKHTDYAGGRSLLCAVERGVCIAGTARADDRVVVHDVGRQMSVSLALDPHLVPASTGWTNYAGTVMRRVARNFPAARRGADIYFASDLPSASGMSSSSALLTSLFLVVADINDLASSAEAAAIFSIHEDLAAYAASIENGQSFGPLAGDRGVGTAGGSEDHTAILCSRADVVSQFSFQPTRLERRVALDPGVTLVVAMSGRFASKTGAARDRYNAAAAAAARLLELWRAATGRADRVLARALSSAPDAADRLRAAVRDSHAPDAGALADRLDQFVEESTVIIPAASDRLEAGDYAAFGELVDRSQALAERCLGNQVPETTALAGLARREGSLAASAFGAGFGGSVWALVPVAGATAFAGRWMNLYRQAFPDASGGAASFVTRPGPPALRVV
jgi:galactokinase